MEDESWRIFILRISYVFTASRLSFFINNLGADRVKKMEALLACSATFFVLLQGLADRNVKFCTRTTLSDNAITNSIDIHRSTSGSLCITVSNNDCGVREYDMERFQLLNHFRYNWPVNVSSVHLDHNSYFLLFHHPYMTVWNCFLNKTAHICESG